MRPLLIDLFCGLGGWAEGFLAEGWTVIGFDIERHRYPKMNGNGHSMKNTGGSWFNIPGPGGIVGNVNPVHALTKSVPNQSSEWMEYPGQLVIQDVLTLHGSQFKDADCIVASPPCQEYSYMAMPWSRAKAIAAEYRSGKRDVKKLTELFDACFRIQKEACAAAGRHIPLIVENVRGAQPWVGRAKWNFGSFYLWGDVPALMPITRLCDAGLKMPVGNDSRSEKGRSAALSHYDKLRHALTNPNENGTKGQGAGWFNDAKRNGGSETGYLSRSGSKSNARKAASAMIAKIPLTLAKHIAKVYYPRPLAVP